MAATIIELSDSEAKTLELPTLELETEPIGEDDLDKMIDGALDATITEEKEAVHSGYEEWRKKFLHNELSKIEQQLKELVSAPTIQGDPDKIVGSYADILKNNLELNDPILDAAIGDKKVTIGD